MDQRQSDLLMAAGLSIGPAIALGFSRFAYALLLPSMRQSLGWTYAAAGSMNTANAAGYIVGSLASAWFARKFGLALGFLYSLALSTLILCLTGITNEFNFLFIFRTVGGVSTAFAFILGASLVGRIGRQKQTGYRGSLMTIYVAGAGAGIVLSGLAVPATLSGDIGKWGEGWLILGLIGAVGLLPAYLAARSVPVSVAEPQTVLGLHHCRRIMPSLVAYGAFGAGYVSYMTFVVDLLRSRGDGIESATLFWLVLGGSALVSIPIWGHLLSRMPGGRGAAIVFALSALGSLAILLNSSLEMQYLSALLFGCSFLAAPAAVALVARQLVDDRYLTAAIALLTVVFAVGQTLGPVLSGYITDSLGSVESGLWFSPVLLGVASLIALLQRDENRT